MCEFKFTGKYESKRSQGKTKIGETEFVKNQAEEGVAKKLKNASNLSLFKVHQVK
jgi:hypothetical protein